MKKKWDLNEIGAKMTTAMAGIFGGDSMFKGNPLMLVIAAVILFFSIRSLGKDKPKAEKAPRKDTKAIGREFEEAVEKRNREMAAKAGNDPMSVAAGTMVQEREARKRKKK